MNRFNDPNYSYGDPNVLNSVNAGHPEGPRLNKSFIDSKPMIQGLVRSVLKVQKNGEAHLINTGLTDVDGAKQIASNLFTFYDKDRSGKIDTVKTMPILANTYRIFNSSYNPQKEDVNSFFETLDVDKNKTVTLEDFEALCVRYLTGTPLGLGSNPMGIKIETDSSCLPISIHTSITISVQGLLGETLETVLQLFLVFFSSESLHQKNVHSNIVIKVFSTLSFVIALAYSKIAPSSFASLLPQAVVTLCYAFRSDLFPTMTITTFYEACSLMPSTHRFILRNVAYLVMSQTTSAPLAFRQCLLMIDVRSSYRSVLLLPSCLRL